MTFRFSRFAKWSVAASTVVALATFALNAATANPPGFPPFPAGDLAPAGLGPREPEIKIDFPGPARARGVISGTAAVSVLIDADGKVADSLIIGYTDAVFGKALLEHIESLTFQPAKLKGTPIPARFDVGYTFESGGSMDAMEAARNRANNLGGPRLAYSAFPENKLDKPLEFTNAVLPKVPVGYATSDDQPIRAFVTFYIDEQGRVHAPNVESVASPQLVAGAIKAVRMWTFKPGTVNGKPVLIFAGRSVGFVPRTP